MEVHLDIYIKVAEFSWWQLIYGSFDCKYSVICKIMYKYIWLYIIKIAAFFNAWIMHYNNNWLEYTNKISVYMLQKTYLKII